MRRRFMVIHYNPTTSRRDGYNRIASELETLIQNHVDGGWDYEGMESIPFWVQGTGGCFGLFAKPGFSSNVQILVFSRPQTTAD